MPLTVVVATVASTLAFALYARVEPPWVALGWIGLVPWLAALDDVPSPRAALEAGVLFAVAFTLAVFGWMVPAISSYTGAPTPVALGVLVVAAPLLQPQIPAFALARHVARRTLTGWWWPALAAAAVYVGTEWATGGKVFGDTIGHGLHASAWMRQAADVAGAHGLTFGLLLANEAVLAAARARTPGVRLRRALVPVGLAAALLAYGAVRSHQLAPPADARAPVRAGIVQANLGDYAGMRAALGSFGAVRAILDAHFVLSHHLLRDRGLDLLVWPETVYPTTFGAPKSPDGAKFDREIGAFVRSAGLPLVFGTYDRDGDAEYNAAMFVAPAASGRVAYRKARLFPLTERVPAWLDSPRLRRWLPWLGTWQPGRSAGVVPVRLRDGRTLGVAPLICYDAVEPELALAAVRQGAEVLLTLSNDAWFASGLGPRLHLIVSAFRSIETRRPQVRATNTGISAVIDATGALETTAGVHERATLVATVRPERDAPTLMLRWGNWFGPAALAAGLVLLAAGWLRPRRRAKAGPG